MAGFAKALLRENGQYVGMVDLDDIESGEAEEENNGPVVWNPKAVEGKQNIIKVGTVDKPATIAQIEAVRTSVESLKKKRGRPPKVK